MSIGRRLIAYLAIEILLINPIGLVFSATQVQAAESGLTELGACVFPEDPGLAPEASADEDPGDSEETSVAAFDLDVARLNPFFNEDQFTELATEASKTNGGHFDESTQSWIFCSGRELDNLASAGGGSKDIQRYLDTFLNFSSKYGMNELDVAAVTGEPCRLFIESTGLCDETLEVDLDAAGAPRTDENGAVKMRPKYFDDIFMSGASYNKWDAPKVDARILKTLVFLVTPVDQGGAGREYIEVSRIIQPAEDSTEITDPHEEADDVRSAHSYDLENPSAPRYLAHGMDISAIDKLRITTRITEKKRACVGGGGVGFGSGCNKVTYKYKDMPIKVAWQTDAGAEAEPIPVDLYHGSLTSFGSSLAGLLSEMGLNAVIDASSIELDDLGSLSQVIGGSLLSAVLNSPDGSLKGWDLASTLDTLGRAYLATELGLDPKALAEGDSVEDAVLNIGRAKAESAFGLPDGSLKGANSSEMWQNTGRRYMEDILGIQPGTLAAKNYTQDELLEKIGQGRIEKELGLQPGSLTGSDWSAITGTAKAKLIFSAAGAGGVDDRLSLGFQAVGNTGKNSFGFTAEDFENPTRAMIDSKSSAAISKYKRLVGSRAIESGIGKFTSAVSTGTSTSAESVDFVSLSLSALGITAQQGTGNLGTFMPSHLAKSGATWTANSNETTSLLIETGAFTEESLKTFVRTSIDAISTGRFTSPGAASAAQAPQTLNEVISNFRKPLQSALTAANVKLTSSAIEASALKLTDILAAQKAVSSALGTVNQYADGLVGTIDLQQQSGRSAAVNLPGTAYASTSDGLLDTSTKTISSDPVSTFLSGNLSADTLVAIGKTVISQAATSGRLNQRTLAGQIKEDLSLDFNGLTKFGIDTTSWESAGLDKDDFERIFTKNLGEQTFKRIGEAELLRVAWNKSGLQNELSGANTSLAKVTAAANQVAAGYEFYSSRLQDLTEIGERIDKSLSSLQASPSFNPSSIRQKLSGIRVNNVAKSINTVKQAAKQYQAALNDPSVKNAPSDILGNIKAANQIINELIAGHELNFSQSADGPSGNRQTANGCVVPNDVRGLIQAGGNLTDFASKTAACRFDTSLNLPSGSIYGWFKSGDTSFDSLTLSIGKAGSGSNKLSDAQAKERGKKLLESAGVASLLRGIPGARAAGITATDVHELLTGNGEATLKKLGGNLMDTYLNWEPGTSKDLISPVCKDKESGAIRGCTQKEAQTERLRTMAQVGLKSLGLELQFPSSLDLRSAGDFVVSFGIARISENLGLEPNSFKGTYKQVVAANKERPDSLLSAFSWYAGPGMKAIDKASTMLQGYAKGTTPAGTAEARTILEDTRDRVKEIVTAYYESVFDALSQAAAAGGSEATQAAAQRLAAAERAAADDVLRALDEARSETILTSGTRADINQASDAITKGKESISADAYAARFKSFLSRTSSLDSQFSLQPGSFKSFIAGTATAEEIAKKEAEADLRSLLDKKVMDRLLGDTPFAKIYDTFREITKTAQCPAGMTISDFILTNDRKELCNTTGIEGLSLDSLFSAEDDNPENLRKRGILYDNLFGRAFGMQLEQRFDLEPGTMRTIALQPWRAKEIAIDQGIRSIGANFLQVGDKAALDTGDNRALFQTFRQAVLAGFCPVNPLMEGLDAVQKELVRSDSQLCSLRFDSTRAFIGMSNGMNRLLQQRYANGFTARKLDFVDLALIFAGGTESLYFAGAARMAYTLNESLGNDPAAQAFKIDFTDVRNSVSNPSLSEADFARAGTAQQASFIRDYYRSAGYGPSDFIEGNPEIDLSSMPDAQVISTFNSDPNIPQDQREYLLQQENQRGKEELPALTREQSQGRLQFQSYDIAAFKIDKNIPRGFSYAMLKGSPADRSHMLGLYLGNTLNLSQNLFGADSGLTNQMVLNLGEYAANCFKTTGASCNAALVSPESLTLLDTWFTGKAENLLGIDLPAGTAQGIFAWGTTGFKGNTFDTSSKVKIGNAEYSPLGTMLRQWGTAKLFAWGDEALGFSAGSTFQIYEAANKLASSQRALSAARTAAPTLNAAGSVFGHPELGTSAASQAKANVTAAQAALITTVVTIAFSKQIGEAEASLGLVPGTGSMGVGILVSLAMGVPVDPITLGLFVAINAFGTYDVESVARATASGYYPYTGRYGVISKRSGSHTEHLTTDPDQGTFNAMDSESWSNGIQDAARMKVSGLMRDLLTMPARWQAMTGEHGNNVWISQLYTGRQEDVDQVEDLVSQPAPWEKKGSFGYGALEKRANLTFDTSTNTWKATAKPGYRAGVYYCLPMGATGYEETSCSFSSHLHVSW